MKIVWGNPLKKKITFEDLPRGSFFKFKEGAGWTYFKITEWTAYVLNTNEVHNYSDNKAEIMELEATLYLEEK